MLVETFKYLSCRSLTRQLHMLINHDLKMKIVAHLIKLKKGVNVSVCDMPLSFLLGHLYSIIQIPKPEQVTIRSR